jgi:hypothetical protein
MLFGRKNALINKVSLFRKRFYFSVQTFTKTFFRNVSLVSDYGGGAECAAWTGHAMRQTNTVHSVVMPNNALGVWGFRWICEGLLQNTSLRTILLGSNTITEDAAVWVVLKNSGKKTIFSCFVVLLSHGQNQFEFHETCGSRIVSRCAPLVRLRGQLRVGQEDR